jgi:hypothetical protein
MFAPRPRRLREDRRRERRRIGLHAPAHVVDHLVLAQHRRGSQVRVQSMPGKLWHLDRQLEMWCLDDVHRPPPPAALERDIDAALRRAQANRAEHIREARDDRHCRWMLARARSLFQRHHLHEVMAIAEARR